MTNSYDLGSRTANSQVGTPTLTILLPQLSICTFVRSSGLFQDLRQFLSSDRYILTNFSSASELLDFVEQEKHQLDCLILQEERELLPLVNQWYEKGTLLPVVIIPAESESESASPSSEGDCQTATYVFHPAEVRLPVARVQEITPFIDQAIAEFLKLSPQCHLHDRSTNITLTEPTNTQNFLMQQQMRLADKLKERLGYLAVYYKRNRQNFFRHLSRSDKQQFFKELKLKYSQIVLDYFPPDDSLNQQIDDFVSLVFFADISVSQVMEIHMELMEELSQSLKIEGRSEEILLDYRLTLIDVIAHLGEMYRRAIPRES